MKIFTIVSFIFIIFCFPSCSRITGNQINNQDIEKIDSVFRFYFEIIEMEVYKTNSPIKRPDLFEIYIDTLSSDTLYLSKHIGEAVLFMQELTNIKMAIKEEADHEFAMNKFVTEDILNQWKFWYKTNKAKLSWDEEQNVPQLIENSDKL